MLIKKGHYAIGRKKADSPLIDTSEIQPLFSQLHIEFDQHYLPTLLQKYFPNHDLQTGNKKVMVGSV
jgi:hypothetical protein